jgi:hypothetical protein
VRIRSVSFPTCGWVEGGLSIREGLTRWIDST